MPLIIEARAGRLRSKLVAESFASFLDVCRYGDLNPPPVDVLLNPRNRCLKIAHLVFRVHGFRRPETADPDEWANEVTQKVLVGNGNGVMDLTPNENEGEAGIILSFVGVAMIMSAFITAQLL